MSFKVTRYPTSLETVRTLVRRKIIAEALIENRLDAKTMRMLCESGVGEIIQGHVEGATYRVNSIDPDNIGNSTLEVVSYPPDRRAVGRIFKVKNILDDPGRGASHPVVQALVAIIEKMADNEAMGNVQSEERPGGDLESVPDDFELADEVESGQVSDSPELDQVSVTDQGREIELSDELSEPETGSSLMDQLVAAAQGLRRITLRDPIYRELKDLSVDVPRDYLEALEDIANRSARVAYVNSNTPGQENAKFAIKTILDAVSLPGSDLPEPDDPDESDYTSKTDEAVRSFQSYVGFSGSSVDGKVGKNTARALLGRPSDEWMRFSGSRTSGPLFVPAVNRAESLSSSTGVGAAGIYAFEARESSHNPDAFAWNGHVFMRHLADDDERQEALDAGFKTRGDSRYGQNARDSFRAAYEINPDAAIKGGAWGLYQVLGVTSLSQYDNADSFLQSFNSDPAGHSMRAFEAWTEARPDFVQNVNNYIANPGTNQQAIAQAVRRYFGAFNTPYTDEVKRNIQRYTDQKAEA